MFDSNDRKPYTRRVKRLAALVTACAYLGLSHFCASYALVTGEFHHAVGSETAAHAEPGHHDEHHSHHEHGGEESDHHDHSSGESGACCSTITEIGAALPSAPQLLAKVITSFPLVVPAADVRISDAWGYFSRMDHGPPRLPAQAVSLSSRAPRAPPTAVL